MTTTIDPGDTDMERLLGTVGEAMTSRVVALTADLPADVAVRRLERAGVSGAPVVQAGRVVGVVTVRDLLAPAATAPPAMTSGPFMRHEQLVARFRVADLMTSEPVVASIDWSLARAGLAMDEAGVNRLPVVDAAGRPVGIFTRDDLISALARRLRAAIRHQEPARSLRPSAMAPD
jgi:CBS domain-containing membrane protein